MAAAAAAAAAFVGLPTARASDVPIEGPQSSDTPGPWTHRHRGLVVGTPTGGGKYPFLVVVVWQAGVQDPRVSCPKGRCRSFASYSTHAEPHLLTASSCASIIGWQTTQDIWCHGTMVTSDVVLVTNSCRPGTFNPLRWRAPRGGEIPHGNRTTDSRLADQGYVMVGDSFNNESMQFRVVSSQETHHGLVSHPAGLHFLFKIEPVTFEGFYPAAINKNTDGVFDGQDVTMVGYGTIDPITESIFPGEAYEAQVKVFSYWEEGFWYWPQAGGSGA